MMAHDGDWFAAQRRRLVQPLTHTERVFSEEHRRLVYEGLDPPLERFSPVAQRPGPHLLARPRATREEVGPHPDIGQGPSDAEDSGVVRVSTVKAERVAWQWLGRLPLGKLVVLDGDPSLGKSTLTLDWTARITTGTPWPDKSGRPEVGNVVLLSAEDGIADTIRPRLEAHGADLARVVVFDSVPTVSDDGKPGPPRPPSIPADLERLERLERIIVAENATFVVVDVLAAFLSGKVDSHRDQDVRGVLMPLAKMAERTGATIIVLRHLSKTGGTNPLYRGGGSIGIIGAARAGMLVGVDPEDEQRRIIAMTKSNLGQIPDALAYRIVTDEERDCARISYDGTTAHRASDLLAGPASEDDGREDAAGVLAEILSEPGEHWVKDCLDRMAGAGFSKDQAKRAKFKLRARSVKVGKPGDEVVGWQWALRAHEGSEGSGSQNPALLAPLVRPSEDDRASDRGAQGLDL